MATDPESNELTELADMLAGAWERGEAVAAPSRLRPSTDLDEAYRIQDLIVERRLSAGEGRDGRWV